jgi:cytochrome c peroxidase
LPPLPVPEDNPLTVEKVELGRKLFYDRRLSLNDTFSCAMCHIPEQGFTTNEMATAVGIEGRTVGRNAPTLLNVAYLSRLFHDGRETSLEQQVWGPLLAPNEMGNPSIGALLEKIKRLPDYRGLFEAAFGRGPTMETLGMALASYQRTLLAAASPFDRWYFGGEEDAVSDAARRGFELFRGRAGCVACHRVDGTHALFLDQDMHNTGIGFRRAMDGGGVITRVQIAPGTYLEVDRKIIERVGEAKPSDLGLYEVTQNPADRWRYRTPTLRNLALTAPYMHDGSLGTLADVIEFYDRGGEPNPELSPFLRPLGLNLTEKGDLLAFLQSLTGEGVDTLLADAFAAEIGDPQPGDPHWIR